MCGRYALALRPQQVRAYLEDEHMPVNEAPEDDAHNAPRQSYNFAPGYYGLVYRADTPDHGAGPLQHKNVEGESTEEDAADPPASGATEVRYKLQSMKWGLIPFWTKRNPDYGSMLKTINCRDDSLIENRGMWTTMKQRKRCVIVFQGFYEWLGKGKEKVPHYVKRKDGQLMCAAGLWDCVRYEGSEEKHYTYTVITTGSNKQLKFLHERMPVILENGSEELRTWLDPNRHTWSKALQGLLKPYEGELEVYPVNKNVGKVGNNSPSFIIPVASSENKSNIANFFAKGAAKKEDTKSPKGNKFKNEDEGVKKEDQTTPIKRETDDRKTIDDSGTEDNAPLPGPEYEPKQGSKRQLDDVSDEKPPRKISKTETTLSKLPAPAKSARKTRSSTSNHTASPSRSGSEKGIRTITSFFGK
ncbi:hypothetical protein B2J93_2167 [Marssonina coronariae]|uniref:DUF159 domain protein n=1 Tax=Diplocarpon coronariae TaxID=2795749 RepID=A0A218Z8T3_9HELO|nr:hypothetical protein B2J93_2167 [Marssonina coronariae]